MSVSNTRLAELRAQFEPTKKKIDDVDRKYSLDYNEPLMDMPESLGLQKLSFSPKTEEELRQEAANQTQAWYLEQLRKLDGSLSADKTRLQQKLLSLDAAVRNETAAYLKNYNESVQKLTVRLRNQGMTYSSILPNYTAKYFEEYRQNVDNANAQADAERDAINAQINAAQDEYDQSVASVQTARDAKVQSAYDKLADSQQKERLKVDKFNVLLDEKEKKYLLTRAKALEQARQAEYDRAFAARKLYQQMGAVGYEEAKIWEKYNLLTTHFSTFTKREEALILIQSDNYVYSHLQDSYSTFIDWINRNVPV